eukprot:scaffold2243_cov165-Amphora_coffeaeformis.AAC.17
MASSMLLFPRILHIGGGASRLLPHVMHTLSLRRPLLVTDPFVHGHMLPSLLNSWRQEQQPFDHDVFYETMPDPTSTVVDEGIRRIQAFEPDCLVAIGGGSPIDAAKAMAYSQKGEKTLPVIAIPTTAGTGSEVTRFSVITQSATGEKKLFADPRMQPLAALVDFSLTLHLPPRVTADTGIDALTHAVEAFVSKKQHPVADMNCLEAMRLIARALRPAYFQGSQDEAAREAMMRAATLAGLAFNHSSVALVHGMSRPFGAHFHWTHGASNAVLFPTLTRWSMDSPSAVERYAVVARTLGVADPTHTDTQATGRLVDELLAINQDLSVPTLPQGGVSSSDWENMIPTMAKQALASGSPNNNPRVPSQSEIEDLYRIAYEETW